MKAETAESRQRMDVCPPIVALRAFISSRQYRGYDPYDALNSPLIRLLTFGAKYGRIAWTQFFRRFPVNLRPLLCFPRHHNPMAIGLFLWGLAKLYRLDPQDKTLAEIRELLELLSKLRSPGYSGSCWGYDFAWQSRAFYLPPFTPTIVATAFNGHALLDTYAATGIEQAMSMALDTRGFILRDLNRTGTGARFCFSYSPLDHTSVHNANLLGASLLARCYASTGDSESLAGAEASMAYTMQHQREDGSWYYAQASMQNWVDSFHTGFNLQAIRYLLDRGLAASHREAYDRGVAYYAAHFFLPDGTPKYYHNRVYPIDIHAPAQAIVFFSGMGETYAPLTDRILHWLMENLYDHRRGYFYFRKSPYHTNRIPYMRWGQAWAFHALTEYLLQTANQGDTRTHHENMV